MLIKNARTEIFANQEDFRIRASTSEDLR